MIATAFDEETGVLDAPPGMSPEECSMLSVYQGQYPDGTPIVISCWKPTAEEWEEMRQTGRVWVIVCGRTMPPIAVTGHKPFEAEPKGT
jgi:hypothetical protein